MSEEELTTTQVASRLSITEETLKHLVRVGEITPAGIDSTGTYLFTTAEVEQVESRLRRGDSNVLPMGLEPMDEPTIAGIAPPTDSEVVLESPRPLEESSDTSQTAVVPDVAGLSESEVRLETPGGSSIVVSNPTSDSTTIRRSDEQTAQAPSEPNEPTENYEPNDFLASAGVLSDSSLVAEGKGTDFVLEGSDLEVNPDEVQTTIGTDGSQDQVLLSPRELGPEPDADLTVLDTSEESSFDKVALNVRSDLAAGSDPNLDLGSPGDLTDQEMSINLEEKRLETRAGIEADDLSIDFSEDLPAGASPGEVASGPSGWISQAHTAEIPEESDLDISLGEPEGTEGRDVAEGTAKQSSAFPEDQDLEVVAGSELMALSTHGPQIPEEEESVLDEPGSDLQEAETDDSATIDDLTELTDDSVLDALDRDPQEEKTQELVAAPDQNLMPFDLESADSKADGLGSDGGQSVDLSSAGPGGSTGHPATDLDPNIMPEALLPGESSEGELPAEFSERQNALSKASSSQAQTASEQSAADQELTSAGAPHLADAQDETLALDQPLELAASQELGEDLQLLQTPTAAQEASQAANSGSSSGESDVSLDLGEGLPSGSDPILLRGGSTTDLDEADEDSGVLLFEEEEATGEAGMPSLIDLNTAEEDHESVFGGSDALPTGPTGSDVTLEPAESGIGIGTGASGIGLAGDSGIDLGSDVGFDLGSDADDASEFLLTPAEEEGEGQETDESGSQLIALDAEDLDEVAPTMLEEEPAGAGFDVGEALASVGAGPSGSGIGAEALGPSTLGSSALGASAAVGFGSDAGGSALAMPGDDSMLTPTQPDPAAAQAGYYGAGPQQQVQPVYDYVVVGRPESQVTFGGGLVTVMWLSFFVMAFTLVFLWELTLNLAHGTRPTMLESVVNLFS